MWPDLQKAADFVTFTEETLNGKLYFLCSVSRKVLSLEACSSNKNPRIIAKFYMDIVTELKGVIKFVRRGRDSQHFYSSSTEILKL